MKPFLDFIRQVDFSTIISRVESRASYYFIIEKFRHHTGQTRTSEDAGGGRKYSNADHNKRQTSIMYITTRQKEKKRNRLYIVESRGRSSRLPSHKPSSTRPFACVLSSRSYKPSLYNRGQDFLKVSCSSTAVGEILALR